MTKANLLQDVRATISLPCKWTLGLPYHSQMSVEIIIYITSVCCKNYIFLLPYYQILKKDLEKVFAKSPASTNFGEWNEIRYCEGEACKEIFTEIFTEA